ncbi:MAG: hypothetical protein KDD38_00785 [Bdellovibrionales bacterium]|nr:hypothetical protein [Bdellovibrionales bacterium]
MNIILNDLSIVVPFTSQDLLWKDLLQDLKALPRGSEILLVGPDRPDDAILKRATENLLAQVRYVESPKGRGVQLNTGAKNASRNYLWFLHADSKVPRPSIFLLDRELMLKADALHYFDLQFLSDGPRLVGLNSMAANLRSRYLGMPFGDQGFAMSRATFLRVGGFSENSKYGEDHIFVWEARRKRILLNRVPGAVFTSARRYESEGWGAVTRTRVILTAKQATSECIKLMKQRLVERRD